MNKPFYILFFVFCNAFSFAQINLVPNPSFEDTTSCPIGAGSIGSLTYWYSPTLSSPDYFNSCNVLLNDAGIPSNAVGFQTPNDGNGYSGISCAFDSSNWNYREYIQVKLLQKLQSNKKYEFSCFISRADSMPYCISEIGFGLSNIAIGGNFTTPIFYSPQLTTPINFLICDAISWYETKTVYTAIGGEEFLTIGSFKDNSSIDTFCISSSLLNSQGAYSYYYIDNVKIVELSNNTPNFFSPNGDNINDEWEPLINENEKIEIFNRWGQKIYDINSTNKIWNGISNYGINCNVGVYYFIKFSNADKKEIIEKGFIQLMR